MGPKPSQHNVNDFLLRFWAFWLTAFYCVVGLFGVVILKGAILDDNGNPYILLCIIAGLFSGFACIAITAFGGLLWRQAWAKPLLLIVAGAALIGFPIGTGFGIMVLLELLSRPQNTKAETAPQSESKFKN